MKKLVIPLSVVLLGMNACTKVDNTPLSTSVSEDVTSPTTWTADKTWVIDGHVGITSDLVIEPGTTVKFNEDAELYVGYGSYGSLTALGTADKPIVFTSNSSNPSAGDYRGIEFFDKAAKSSALSYCTMEYGGNDYGYGAELYVEGTSISLTNCTIQNSASEGILNENGSFTAFSMNTIKNCNGYPVEVPVAATNKLDSLSNISGTGVLLNSRSLGNQKVTWQALTVPYIADYIDINDNGELTISPGTTIKFLPEGRIETGYATYGKFTALGTVNKPIIFTSAASNPSTGDWRGLEFFDKAGTNSSMDYCTVEYAGNNNGYGANVYVEYASLSLKNSTIKYSATMGVQNYLGSFTNFSGNTISDCANYPVALPAQAAHTIASNNNIAGIGVLINESDLQNQIVTWNKLTVPYILNSVYIYDNAELTIAPGTDLLFLADGRIEVGYSTFGKLVANGTADEPIVFSSAASSPSNGDWRDLEFFDHTMNGTVLNYCTVSYAGNAFGYGANVYSESNSSKLTIQNSTLSNSAGCGIKTYNCNPVLTNVTYENNVNDICN